MFGQSHGNSVQTVSRAGDNRGNDHAAFALSDDVLNAFFNILFRGADAFLCGGSRVNEHQVNALGSNLRNVFIVPAFAEGNGGCFEIAQGHHADTVRAFNYIAHRIRSGVGYREGFHFESGDLKRLAVFDLDERRPFFAGLFLQSQVVFQKFLRIGSAVNDEGFAFFTTLFQLVALDIQKMRDTADMIHMAVRQQKTVRFEQIRHEVVITRQPLVRKQRPAVDLKRMRRTVLIGVGKLIAVSANSVRVIPADGFPC